MVLPPLSLPSPPTPLSAKFSLIFYQCMSLKILISHMSLISAGQSFTSQKRISSPEILRDVWIFLCSSFLSARVHFTLWRVEINSHGRKLRRRILLGPLKKDSILRNYFVHSSGVCNKQSGQLYGLHASHSCQRQWRNVYYILVNSETVFIKDPENISEIRVTALALWP